MKKLNKRWKTILLNVSVAMCIVVSYSGITMADQAAFDPVVSERGQYQIVITPDEPVTIGSYMTWSINVIDNDSMPANVSLKLRGGMRAHGHGLSTAPQITQIATGQFRVEGLFFNMPGSWYLFTDLIQKGVSVDTGLLEFSVDH